MISRRSFFTKLAGAAVTVKAVPVLTAPVCGYSRGAHIGAIAGSFTHSLTLTLDGKALAASVAPHLPAVLRRQGL